MRPSKKNARGQGGTGQGIQEQSQRGDAECGLLGTDEANESRISELQVAMDAAIKAGDMATFKGLFAQWNFARAARSPEHLHRLDEKHRTAVELAVALGDHGLRLVPAAWLESETGRAMAWRTSRPVGAEAMRARKVA